MLHETLLAAHTTVEAGIIGGSIRFVLYSIGGIIAAIICAIIAGAKGRNPLGWGILGLFFSIITLIVIIVIPSKK
ncbi:MAG: deoxyribodipyrimidine photolyase [Mycobacteriaceae bacterium]|nr:deoxyribodipyrimidine photolyase [Mycobacteriaceae bacterium]MBV9512685.1 deoxyribodipyrimidine photolyase [Mycobacteriaceae bacterium]